MDKLYIEREYRQAVSDFKCAHTEDEQWMCRSTMARLQNIAMQLFGFEYADSLTELSSELEPKQ